jgi:hypothetical protein
LIQTIFFSQLMHHQFTPIVLGLPTLSTTAPKASKEAIS